MSDRPAQPIRKLSSLQESSPSSGGSSPSRSGSHASSGANKGWHPSAISSIEDTGLSKLNVADLVLKVVYSGGDMTGYAISDIVKLPFSGVLDKVIDFLKREKYLEITGGTGGGVGEASYRYAITSKGDERARAAMERTQYAGPAPVTLEHYIESIHEQNFERPPVQRSQLRTLMENLVIADEMLDRIGPAVNSGRSIFLYGPPGNGKTTIAERVGELILGRDMWIPYAVDVDGQVIQLFDEVNHVLSTDPPKVSLGTGMVRDPRWVCIKRPMIMVGGELMMDGLDLVYDNINKYYEAPFQMKATGGLFLIDDFGRQQVSPVKLLNRWIVPLETGVDFLTLNNGRKIGIPFHVLIIFSTNLDPKDLVDEAFLRRIRYKIEVGNPTLEQYREIWTLMCRIMRVPYDEKGLAYLLKEWYAKYDRDLRMVHPRDLLSQLIDIAAYLGISPTMSNKELLDQAAASYFVEL